MVGTIGVLIPAVIIYTLEPLALSSTPSCGGSATPYLPRTCSRWLRTKVETYMPALVLAHSTGEKGHSSPLPSATLCAISDLAGKLLGISLLRRILP
jgi:hypothetical protein